MFDLLIKDARVVDGTGQPSPADSVRASVGVTGDELSDHTFIVITPK